MSETFFLVTDKVGQGFSVHVGNMVRESSLQQKAVSCRSGRLYKDHYHLYLCTDLCIFCALSGIYHLVLVVRNVPKYKDSSDHAYAQHLEVERGNCNTETVFTLTDYLSHRFITSGAHVGTV